MTFGKLRNAKWLTFDKYGVNIYIRIGRSWCLEQLNSFREDSYSDYNNLDLDKLIEKIKDVSEEKKMYWEFELIGGTYYFDVVASGQLDYVFSGDYDDFKVDCIDLKNFKLPTFFIARDDN